MASQQSHRIKPKSSQQPSRSPVTWPARDLSALGSHLSPSLTSTPLASQHQLFPHCRIFFPRCFGFAHFVNEINLDCVNSTHFKTDLDLSIQPCASPPPPYQALLFNLLFFSHTFHHLLGFPGGVSDKESTCQCKRCKRLGLEPRIGKLPGRRARQPTPIFLPGESHGHRSLVSYSPWGRRARRGWSDLACSHSPSIIPDTLLTSLLFTVCLLPAPTAPLQIFLSVLWLCSYLLSLSPSQLHCFLFHYNIVKNNILLH